MKNEGRDPTTLQTDAEGLPQVVFPSDYATGTFSYPAPVAEECPKNMLTKYYGYWEGLEEDKPSCLLCERQCKNDDTTSYEIRIGSCLELLAGETVDGSTGSAGKIRLSRSVEPA